MIDVSQEILLPARAIVSGPTRSRRVYLEITNDTCRSSGLPDFRALKICTIPIHVFARAFQLAGLVAASTAAEASNEALKAMLAQDHGAEGGVLDAWLTLSAHKVHYML